MFCLINCLNEEAPRLVSCSCCRRYGQIHSGFMGLWYKNTRPKPVLPRDTVIAMLQRIDKESYMILCQMAACVSEIIKNAPIPPAPEQIQ